MADENFFVTPTDPEGFSVPLEPSTLRNIDFSALEFSTLRRATIEYVRTYFRTEFNDFVASNGFIMLMEIVDYVAAVLAQRADILVNESFLPTSRTTEAVSNHLNLIGQEIQRQTPAVLDVECSVISPVATDIKIPARFRFNLAGPDGAPLFYEIYSAPNDFNSEIIIPSGKRAVIAFGLEGRFGDLVNVVSAGGPNQIIEVVDSNILDDPIFVKVGETEELFRRVAVIEKSGAQDKVYEVRFTDAGMAIRFGDDVAGQAPIAGQPMTVEYRVGGGRRGRISTGFIGARSTVSPEPPASAGVEVNFRNLTPSSGGQDEESLSDAKKRGPQSFATHNNAVSGPDYVQLASKFNHPVFGSVSKALATVKTSINANIVELFILAEGEGDIPVTASTGLKTGLRSALNEVNVLTDDVVILDGAIRPVDVEATVVVSRNADVGTVKTQVDAAIDDFFSIDHFEMGQPLYVSDIYEILMAIDGVKYVNIFDPVDDILPASDVGSGADGVGFNELITLGDKAIKIFFEKSR